MNQKSRLLLIGCWLVGAAVLMGACGRLDETPRGSSPSPSPSTQPQEMTIQDAEVQPTGLGWVLRPDGLFVRSGMAGPWDQIALPEQGVGIHAAAVSDARRAWVATVTAAGIALDHTDDGGANWDQLVLKPLGEPGALSLLFDGVVGVVLVTHVTSTNFSSGEIFSTTNGRTWERHDVPIAGDIALMRPTTILLAGGAQGDELWRSNDLGRTWTRTILPVSDSADAVGVPQVTSSASAVLAATVAGDQQTAVSFYTTKDRGSTWTRRGAVDIPAGAGPGVAFPIAAFGDDNWIVVSPPGDHLYVTADGGTTFRDVRAEGLPSGVAEVTFADASLGWSRVETGFCAGEKTACSTSSGLYETKDGGASWHELQIP